MNNTLYDCLVERGLGLIELFDRELPVVAGDGFKDFLRTVLAPTGPVTVVDPVPFGSTHSFFGGFLVRHKVTPFANRPHSIMVLAVSATSGEYYSQ